MITNKVLNSSIINNINNINKLNKLNNYSYNNNNNNNKLLFKSLINFNNNNKYFSTSKNYNNFKNFKENRKFYEEQYHKQKQYDQEQRNKKYYKEQENQYQYQEQQQQQQQQPISIPIFKIFFKLLGTILFGWLKRKFTPTEYKDLFEFTKKTIQNQKQLIELTTGQPLMMGEPKVISTTFIPRHSQFMNQEDQVMLVCQLPTPPPQIIGGRNTTSLHCVTLARSLPDTVVKESFPWNLFSNDGFKTVKSAEPIRITLLIDDDNVNPLGFVFNEKRELLLYNNEEEEQKMNYGTGSYQYYENGNNKSNVDQQDGDEDDEYFGNDQYYQERHQNNRNHQNQNNQNKKKTGETIVLDVKDFHEVTNKKK